MRKLSKEEFIKRAKEIHGNKFDYSLVNYINNRTKVKIICSVHGIFEQTPAHHICHKNGCPKCRYINNSKTLRKTTQSFIEKAKKIHPEYDYSKVEYVTARTKVKIICPKHGTFLMRPNNLLGGQGCPRCGTERMANNQTLSQEEFINRVRKIHPEYDYSKVNYVGYKTKISVICREHGEFKISPQDMLQDNCGCKKCGILKRIKIQTKTLEQFIKDARNIHGNKYDYSLVEYKNNKTKVKIICPKHGIFEQTPECHINYAQNCPRCNNSRGEETVSKWLDNNGYVINKDYFREYKFKELGQKRYDFYIPSKNFLIEYNGKQHYMVCLYNDSEQKLKEQRHSDWIKRKFAKDKGIELLTILYTEFDNIETILENKIGSL